MLIFFLPVDFVLMTGFLLRVQIYINYREHIDGHCQVVIKCFIYVDPKTKKPPRMKRLISIG
ncbi:MAG: hypothetical protein BGO40_00365 [Chryseobacterium sp. 39-10]|nr:MAG: hypothetical protein BGO40_00365 [Chryseobacterium sp. 39-10]